jgi:hypothetical protein
MGVHFLVLMLDRPGPAASPQAGKIAEAGVWHYLFDSIYRQKLLR